MSAIQQGMMGYSNEEFLDSEYKKAAQRALGREQAEAGAVRAGGAKTALRRHAPDRFPGHGAAGRADRPAGWSGGPGQRQGAARQDRRIGRVYQAPQQSCISGRQNRYGFRPGAVAVPERVHVQSAFGGL